MKPIVIKKTFVDNYLNKDFGLKQANNFNKAGLLPLYPSIILSRIVGHLVSDGTLCKDKYVGNFNFYGNKSNLEKIRKDIKFLFKIEPKYFYKREGGFILRYNNCKISRLLELVGVPRGNKVIKSFDVPLWIKKADMKIKKSFVRAICDDEMSSPRLNKQGNITSLRLKFNKEESILDSGILFLKSLKQLFTEFGIVCSNVKLNNEKYIGKNGYISRSIYINISQKLSNFIKFYNSLNFDDIIKRRKLYNIIQQKVL